MFFNQHAFTWTILQKTNLDGSTPTKLSITMRYVYYLYDTLLLGVSSGY